ncbi:MAG: molecular chaperone DnaJ [Myxococcales bacterium]|nr:molecular chaperone DnaJ [Myxococcales bacterium]MDH5306566.1 molecular chaperone DnaJ [Myxococcales bacterium]
MAKRDYYEILGVPRDADAAALKTAYRAIAMRDHPDRNPGDAAAEERFKDASEAYAILSDTEKRRAYDRFGHAGVGGGAPGGFQDFGDLGGFTDLFDDLFGDLFGGAHRAGGRRRSRGQRGADLRYNLEIGLADVLEGFESKIKIPKMRVCKTCDGSGARPGTSPETCGTCRGVGQVVLQQGFFRVSRPCDACAGAGETVRDRCADCRGQGRVEGQQTINIRIPAGADDGTRLRLAGEGEAGIAGGSAGDLYVVISIKPHEFFERRGSEIHCQVPVTMVQAALGAEIEVPTLEGKVKITIPEGTQTGKVLRLRGKGLPTLRSAARGDQLLHVFVETPAKLTGEQRELLERFAEKTDSAVSPANKGFLDKLRDLFD